MALELVLRARHCLSLERLDEAEALAREAAGAPACTADALHIVGAVQRRRGKLDAAEAALRQAIARDAKVAAYHNELGNVLQDRGKLKEAIAAYQRALRLHPAYAEAWNDLGTARYARGELEAAVDCYRNAVRLRADHVVAYANLGAVYRKLGLLNEARRTLQKELLWRLRLGARALWRPRTLDLGSASRLAAAAAEQLQAGHARHAAEIAKRALELDGAEPAALHVLGAALLLLGRAEEALAATRRAADAQPADAALQLQLAQLYLQRGDAAAAAPLLRQALRRRPDDPQVHAALGEVSYRQKRLPDAEAAYRRALELDARHFVAQLRLSDLLRNSGRLDQAEAAARRALELDDESAASHFALGMAHKAQGRLQPAIGSFRRALELDPASVQSMQQLALSLREEDQLEEAAAQLRAALRLRPDDAALLADLGVVLADLMRYDEALACLDRALAREPESVLALNRKALLVDHLGERARGLELLREAARLAPDDAHARYNLGLHHLKHGEYAEGWDGYEQRRGFDSFVGKHRQIALPDWDGASPAGRTLLVLPEQGLGDEIMFGSCIPDLAAQARHVIVECDAKLEAIFRRSFAQCTVISRQRTLANDWVQRLEPRPDAQVPAGSLAGRFRRRAADFPQHQGFLKADAQQVAAWRERLQALGPGRKIGLSWQGGVGFTGRKRRSLTLEQLLPILRLPGIQFVNLQYTDVREERHALESRRGVKVHHWQEAIDDYDQTASLVAALDSVLTVCTAIVHLTGALGRPALVMVPFGADWRYGAAGERMIWYPSVRLLRQRRIGDWSEVLREVSSSICS